MRKRKVSKVDKMRYPGEKGHSPDVRILSQRESHMDTRKGMIRRKLNDV